MGLHQRACVAAGGGRHVDQQSAVTDPAKPSVAGKGNLVAWAQRQNVSPGLGIKII